MGDAEEESHETRTMGDDSYVANTTNALQAQYERELNLMRREAALRERELALARREIEMLRETQQRGHIEGERVEATSVASESTSSQVQSRVSISAVADLLGQFDGSSESYERWEKQVRLLKATFKLDDSQAKLLMGSRLKGKTSE